MKALYFGAGWCGQCKVFRPKFEAHCKSVGMDFQVVDVEKDEALVARFGIRNIPYVVVLDDQDEVAFSGMAAETIDLI